MNYFNEAEKSLKRYLKSKVSITMATVVGFLIVGTVSLGASLIPEIPTGEDVVIIDTSNIQHIMDPDKTNENGKIVINGENTNNGAETSSVFSVNDSGETLTNKGEIWVTDNGKKGYAQAMGNNFGIAGTIVNEGKIYIIGKDNGFSKAEDRIKGMAIDKGSAYNRGTIVVTDGVAMTDNSGSTEKIIVNDINGTIVVEGSGAGIFYRKEAITNGFVENKGTIKVEGNGIGVLVSNDKVDESYNGKVFTNSGEIIASGDGAKAIYSTSDDFTLKLEKGSHIEGVINLSGDNNVIDINEVGSIENPENNYIDGKNTVVRVNKSHIVLDGVIENNTYREDMKAYENNGTATYYGDTTVAINVTELGPNLSSSVTNNGTIVGKIGIGTYDKGAGTNNFGAGGEITVTNNGTIKASEYGIWHNVYENNKCNKMSIVNNKIINVESSEDSDASYGIFAGGLPGIKVSEDETITTVENNGDIYVKNENINNSAKGIFIHSRTKGINKGNIVVESENGKGALGVYILNADSSLPSTEYESKYKEDYSEFINDGKITVIGENSKGILVSNTTGFKSEVVNDVNGIIEVDGINSYGVKISGDNSIFTNKGIIKLGMNKTGNIAIYNEDGAATNSGIIQVSDMTKNDVLSEVSSIEEAEEYLFANTNVDNKGVIVDKNGIAIFEDEEAITGGVIDTDDLNEVEDKNGSVTIAQGADVKLVAGENPAELGVATINGVITVVDPEEQVEVKAEVTNITATGKVVVSEESTLVVTDGIINKITGEAEGITTYNEAIENNGTLVLKNMSINGNIVGVEGTVNTFGENTVNGKIEGTFNIGNSNTRSGKINVTTVTSNSSFGGNINIKADGQLVLELGKDNENALDNSKDNSNGITVTGDNIADNGDIALDTSSISEKEVTISLGSENKFENIDVTTTAGDNGIYVVDDSKLEIEKNVTLTYNQNLYKDNATINNMNKEAYAVNNFFSQDVATREKQLDTLYANNIYSETARAAYDMMKLNEESVLSLNADAKVGEWVAAGKALYNKTEYDRTGTVGEYSAETETSGLMAGLEYGVNETTSVGVAFSGAYQDIDTKGGSADGNVFYLGTYAKKQIGKLSLTAGLGYQYGDYDADNTAANVSSSASYDVNAYSAYVEGRYGVDLGDNVTLEPKLKLGYTYVDQDNVSDDYFRLSDSELSTFDAEVGADLVKTVALKSGKLDVRFGASYVRAFGDTDDKFTGSFAGSTGSFDVLGAELSEDTAKFDLGVEVSKDNGVFYNLGGTLRVGSDNTRDYGVKLGAGYKF